MTITKYLCAAALLAVSVPAHAEEVAAGSAAPAPTCETVPVKKKGFGLGGLLGAAKRAGVGDMLGGRMSGGMFGYGKGGQIANAVAGTALEAATSAVTSKADQSTQPAPCTPVQEQGK
jgi:hypothetical protein